MFDLNFWKGKKVFLTGHTGFKGSWMLCVLKYLQAECFGYALKPNTDPNMYEIIDGNNLCVSTVGNICDYDKLQKALENSQAEIVIHMAAQPIVIESYKNPRENYLTNVMGTVNILEAVRHNKSVKAFINVTTDKVYENVNKDEGYTEDERLGGYDPYSNSKACSELITSSFRQSFFNTEKFEEHKKVIATARAGNVLGGGDWAADRLIPDCVRAAISGSEILVRNAKAIRPWQHVLEPVCGYLKFAEYMLKYGKDYSLSLNFGPNEQDCKTVGEIINLFCKKWGNLKYSFVDAVYHEAKLLKLNSALAEKLLGWKGKYSAEQTVSAVIDWTKAYINKENMQDFTIKQIKEYLRY